MKKILMAAAAVAFLCSCGGGKGFRLKGSIKGIEQGEVYIYNAEGLGKGLDTVMVNGGSFEYRAEVEQPTYYILVFPNKYQQVVFADKGAKVSLEGDGSSLKDMQISGDKENERFSDFRKAVASIDESQIPAKAEEFIKNNPTSMASIYLVNKYFIEVPKTDWGKVESLLKVIKGGLPKNAMVDRMLSTAKEAQRIKVGGKCPSFKITTKDGKTLTQGDLKDKITLITFWASWDADSRTLERNIRKLYKKYPSSKLQIIGVSLDVDKQMWRNAVRYDSLTWNESCDFAHYENRMVKDFVVSNLPSNFLIGKDGKIIAMNLLYADLEKKLDEVVK